MEKRSLKKKKIVKYKYKRKRAYLYLYKSKLFKRRGNTRFLKKIKKFNNKKVFNLLFIKFLKILCKSGNLSKVKVRIKLIFYIIKKYKLNPFKILIEAILSSFPFFEFKMFSNKIKKKNAKRIKKTEVKIYFKPLLIKKKRQIFLGFNLLKKYSKEEKYNFAVTLIKTAFNKGNLVKELIELNKKVYNDIYKLEKNLKNNIYN